MGNKIKLLQKHINILENLPEQGMGYQIVDITLKDGKILKERIVINSTYLQLEENEKINPNEIEEIILHKKK